MSVVFDRKAGEIGGDGWNLMDTQERSKCSGRSRGLVWYIGTAACLGLLYLLLLVVILSYVVNNDKATSPQGTDQLQFFTLGQTECENLTLQWIQLQKRYNKLSESTQQLQTMFSSKNAELDAIRDERDQLKMDTRNLTKEMENLTLQGIQLQKRYNKLSESTQQLQTMFSSKNAELDAIRDERDQLKMDTRNLTKEMELLQSRFNTVVTMRDELQEEVKRLNLNRTEKLCPDDWKKYNNKCYYVSAQRVSKSWDKSKKDCEDRGAHLAIINSRDEQDFVSKFYDRTWIGLSDKDLEGHWKWVDGTDLVGDGYWQEGEPNNDRNIEHCAEVSRKGGGWNDMPCSERLSWVCNLPL
ncbi:C-type lectin domain family 4 member F-like [Scomber japonicus]|uniref:C-type lectin domain family 4 member F-like n=1 Tax=Scomber japonicus TaxID=13676 RepID=UPI002304ECF6|nr:C-type lectin domain family 4 member F-like [Scomber japonicus]